VPDSNNVGAGSRRGRPRSAGTDRSIRDAALQLLRTQGPRAVTIDAVAALSGVARTTIYRRHDSRADLLAAILDELVATAAPAPTLPVTEKLRWVLVRAAAVLEEGIGRGGVAAVLTGSDPAFTDALRERLTAQTRALTEAVSADVEAGLVGADVDPDALVQLLFGACLGELLMHGRLRRGWIDRTADLLAPSVETS
jgi:AcrR family transcriptional regulator